ncbi:MAG: hypothetical protein U9R56_07440, partial [candidate division Zixibacteria bacterium]|nr:hypothetical protein [candidate division Zixibacteria bacterium]
MASPTFFLSAGDPSGDNAASRLVIELNKVIPGLSWFGLGGDKLKQLGQQQFVTGSELAVLGFWEVAKRFRFFQKLLKRCTDDIRSRCPSCIILVDYPGFNLRLARRIRSLGIPIVYYISPQVWAWGGKRLREIRELVDLMLPILPFEQEMYERNGINSRFVGHYLLEDITAEYVKSPVPNSGHLALLPGSRPQEVERMLPSMLKAANMFYGKYGTRSVIAGVTGVFDYDQSPGCQMQEGVSVIYDDPRRVVFDSSLVLASSGTATLEAAVIGR